MREIATAIPDVDVLLSLEPEEIAGIILRLLPTKLHNGGYHPGNGIGELFPAHSPAYPLDRMAEVEIALAEAWAWLQSQLLIVPAAGWNGSSGWVRPSRRGRAAGAGAADFHQFRQAVAVPRILLHPLIAERAWLALARREFDTAVFQAFKMVEIAVRDAGGYEPTDLGVKLMRKAFDPDNGRLADPAMPAAERRALADLATGAIGSYKNPFSHRNVQVAEAREAVEMVMLASHLLYIVDSRRAKLTGQP